MKLKQLLFKTQNGHKHNWVLNGRTKDGQQRYICTECGKTCSEFSSDLAKLYYRNNLRLIHSYASCDDNYIWDEVFNYDENGEIEDYFEPPFYKLDKRTVTWKQFQRIIRNGDFSPLVVYTVKDPYAKTPSDLCVFEVVCNE